MVREEREESGPLEHTRRVRVAQQEAVVGQEEGQPAPPPEMD